MGEALLTLVENLWVRWQEYRGREDMLSAQLNRLWGRK